MPGRDINSEPVVTPFDTIALAFSGGGFRAASFNLGVLCYLNELKGQDDIPLLRRVTYISSASGGTVTNAMYALGSAQGKTFGEIYKKIYESMDGVDLLEVVFKMLNDDTQWKDGPHTKRRNLINAFALAYDGLILDGKSVSDLVHAAPGNHLEEVCFNTTEFFRGLLFRHSIKMKEDKKEGGFLYGNFTIHLAHEAAQKLRLGDLMAASSCFPGGFEPLIFPTDFANTAIDAPSLNKAICIELEEINHAELNLLYGEDRVAKVLAGIPPPVTIDKLVLAFKEVPLRDDFAAGFMDGGITDNQGVDSMMYANIRRDAGHTDFKPFDLMLVNDVGSHFMQPYQLPEVKKGGKAGISVRAIRYGSGAIAIAALAVMIWLICCVPGSVGVKIAIAVLNVVMLAGVIVVGGILALRKFIRAKIPSGDTSAQKGPEQKLGSVDLGRSFHDSIVGMFFKYFGGAPLKIIVRMAKERFNSILTLDNDVFVKRIRYLLYEELYSKSRGAFRVKGNHVYDLAFSNDRNRLSRDTQSLDPGNRIQTVAQAAFEMGTTLWFDSANKADYKQAALVATGQATTCYNLLDYIAKLKRGGASSRYAALDDANRAKVDFLEQRMEADYAKFKEEPFWLYNQLLQESGVQGNAPRSWKDFPFPEGFVGLREQ